VIVVSIVTPIMLFWLAVRLMMLVFLIVIVEADNHWRHLRYFLGFAWPCRRHHCPRSFCSSMR
jgi:hypothetical protein